MRLAAIACLALTACGSEAPSPLERQEAERDLAERAAEARLVTLGPLGLTTSAATYPFSTDRVALEAGLLPLLGEPERNENADCGAGALMTLRYDEGLILNIRDERFVGWYYDGEGGDIALSNGIAPGVATVDLGGAYRPIDSTLDGEFTYGDALGGFADADRVRAFYAGNNCFAR